MSGEFHENFADVEHTDPLDGHGATGPDFDEIAQRLGEQGYDVSPEHQVEAARIGCHIAREILAWILTDKPLKRARALYQIGLRAVAAGYVIDGRLLKATVSHQKAMTMAGFEKREMKKDGSVVIKELEFNPETGASKVKPGGECFQTTIPNNEIQIGPSLRSIAKDVNMTAANIAPLTAEFSRKFGLVNRAQSHDWRTKDVPYGTGDEEGQGHDDDA